MRLNEAQLKKLIKVFEDESVARVFTVGVLAQLIANMDKAAK
jgi:hypothetical protein